LEIQNKRWSCESREAFNLLKQITKYNQYSKRDGEIVNKIQLDDGTIVTKLEDVNKIIIEQLKKIQTSETEPKYDEELPLPKLPKLEVENADEKNNSHMERILKRMSINKAIAFDGFSDTVFRLNGAKKVLANIWDYDFPDKIYNETKLVALNKLYPKTPGPKDFRPINIMSQGMKLKETRFADKLYKYLEEDLFKGQTGFVPKMGCLVNQVRVIDRIKQKTENSNTKQIVYGLFIDFSSAYNTILHSKLFSRLQRILDKEEIDYIKALYSRNKVRLGEFSFVPNVGVAQGSVISPALFDIYLEDLLIKIERSGVNMLDIFAYADDVLVLCSSLTQLIKIIDVIRSWSKENNLYLNEKKSAIVPFQQRRGKERSQFTLFEENCITEKKSGKSKIIKVPKAQTYEGLPILHEYKYLGLWLDYRLQFKHQLKHIRDKSAFISKRLYPMLINCSLETRSNLWSLLCRPLLEQTFALFESEPSASNKELLMSTIRTTFKRMTLLNSKVENKVIEKFIGYDFIQKCRASVDKARYKWNCRIGRSEKDSGKLIREKTTGIRKYQNLMPKELVDYTNILTSKCTKCVGKIARSSHMDKEHNINIPNALELWDQLNKIFVYNYYHNSRTNRTERKIHREKTIQERAKFTNHLLQKIKQVLD